MNRPRTSWNDCGRTRYTPGISSDSRTSATLVPFGRGGLVPPDNLLDGLPGGVQRPDARTDHLLDLLTAHRRRASSGVTCQAALAPEGMAWPSRCRWSCSGSPGTAM